MKPPIFRVKIKNIWNHHLDRIDFKIGNDIGSFPCPTNPSFFVCEGAVTKEPISHLDPGCFTNCSAKINTQMTSKSKARWFNSWPFYPLVGGHTTIFEGLTKNTGPQKSRSPANAESPGGCHTSEASEWRDHLGNLEWYPSIIWYHVIQYDQTLWHDTMAWDDRSDPMARHQIFHVFPIALGLPFAASQARAWRHWAQR